MAAVPPAVPMLASSPDDAIVAATTAAASRNGDAERWQHVVLDPSGKHGFPAVWPLKGRSRWRQSLHAHADHQHRAATLQVPGASAPCRNCGSSVMLPRGIACRDPGFIGALHEPESGPLRLLKRLPTLQPGHLARSILGPCDRCDQPCPAHAWRDRLCVHGTAASLRGLRRPRPAPPHDARGAQAAARAPAPQRVRPPLAPLLLDRRRDNAVGRAPAHVSTAAPKT